MSILHHLESRLSANYDDRRERKERKRTEKSVSDEQVLLITRERKSSEASMESALRTLFSLIFHSNYFDKLLYTFTSSTSLSLTDH